MRVYARLHLEFPDPNDKDWEIFTKSRLYLKVCNAYPNTSDEEWKRFLETNRMSESLYLKVCKAYPNASDEDWKTFLETNRMSERSRQEGREYLEEQEEIRRREEFRQRLLNCSIDYQEDEDKTLVLGTEKQEEAFKTCSEPDASVEEDTAQDGSQKRQDDEDMFRDGSDERPYEDREIDVDARNKGQIFFEALEKNKRYTNQTEEEE